MAKALERPERWLILSGILFLILSSISVVRQALAPYRQMVIVEMDGLIATVRTARVVVLETIASNWSLPQQIEALEQENRRLYSRLAQSEQQQLTSATGSAALPTRLPQDTFRTGALSYGTLGWIVLIEQSTGIRAGDGVLLDGVYLGTIDHVGPHASSVKLIGENREPLVVIHTASGKRGILSVEEEEPTLQLLERVTTIQVGDSIATIPDGEHMIGSYPLATVVAIDTDPAATGSQMTLSLLGQPTIGAFVHITTLR